MRFRRASVSYGISPEPVTPYQRAGQAWDERLGSARVQAANWRLMAFGCLGLAFASGAGLLWQAGRSTVTPYVVEVDHAGEVHALGKAATPYQPSDAQIAFHLARFITDVRSLPIDPVVVRRDWLEAYEFTTDRGAAVLNDYARQNDPFAKVGKTSISVEVASVVRASPNSFQIRWTEQAYADGALVSTDHWTAIAEVVVQTPTTEEKLRRNPLGIYVNGLSWSRDLTTPGPIAVGPPIPAPPVSPAETAPPTAPASSNPQPNPGIAP
jgi:type IV secretion system protein VirB5